MSVSDVVMSLEMSGFPGSTSKGLSKIGDLLRCRACPGRMYFMFMAVQKSWDKKVVLNNLL